MTTIDRWSQPPFLRGQCSSCVEMAKTVTTIGSSQPHILCLDRGPCRSFERTARVWSPPYELCLLRCWVLAGSWDAGFFFSQLLCTLPPRLPLKVPPTQELPCDFPLKSFRASITLWDHRIYDFLSAPRWMWTPKGETRAPVQSPYPLKQWPARNRCSINICYAYMLSHFRYVWYVQPYEL